jgi:hypothetical protein
LKANFKISKTGIDIGDKVRSDESVSKQNFSKEEFEQYIIKSGAVGSFMIYRSNKKDDELGISEL